ncbi:DUF4132 domain-containing protein [Ralstonia nicotianae]|uniref:DUF4132 domain-containing protein n=1 Tax=Ralstonia pseudosolanacearum TaxID=1310165 RepID=UPI002003C2F7|nr:DUF4132 domain-containing protein [Ralstonia pseudosolanacearum]MCK4120730.1 DUF4132 domain-containing protein [Ralstonia pseudosolanacearum]
MGILDKILGVVTGKAGKPAGSGGLTPEQVRLLAQAFETLGHAGSGLPEQALAFVRDGEQPNVLLALQHAAASEPGQWLGGPGRLRWKFHARQNTSLETAGNTSLESRARFYASLSAQTAPLEALVRLGKLLAAADGGKSLDRLGAPVPDWLQYLVNDAVFASFNDHRPQTDLGKTRPAWNILLIARLLEHEELDPMLALQLVFERKDLPHYHHGHVGELTQAPAVAEFMRAHREATEALPGQLSAAGRTALVQRIGKDAALLNDFASLFVRLAADGSKGVRSEAIPYLDGIAEAERLALLGTLLTHGDSTQRAQAAELLVRLPVEAARPRLEAALAAEASKPVQQAIRAAITRLDAAGDAGSLALPDPPAWTPIADTALDDSAIPLLKDSRVELLNRARRLADEEIERNKTQKYTWAWQQQAYKRHQKVSDEDLRAILRVFNGQASKSDLKHMGSAELRQIATHGNRLQALPEFGAAHTIRWVAATTQWMFWFANDFQHWLGRQPEGSVDLRALAELLQRSGQPIDDVAAAALAPLWDRPSASRVLPPERVWPFFAEHPEFIDEGLGLVAPTEREHRRSGFDLGATLDTLATFPTMPARWLPRVMEIALGEGKTHRAGAQQALSTLPDIGRRVIESLAHSKSEVRIEAANWLAELRYAPAVEALTRSLDKESRETVRAAFLTALEVLGEDISPRLASATLLAEAQKGLKAKLPAGLAWFPFDVLPACRWSGGDAVESEIVRWWVVLAYKLKEPGGNALLTRYAGLLDPASRQALGGMVLRQFLSQDTRRPSLEEGIAYAQAHAPQRWQGNQQRWQNARPEHKRFYEAEYNKSQEQVFEECKREKMSEYLGSAIGEKGILALAAFAPAHEAVTLLRQYMRDHYQRRAQLEAMLEATAAGNDPIVIQLLLSLSRRYRTASVQEKARLLVQQIAQRNGWSQEQLADRTIPSAGLDDTGTLALQYGERVFIVVLDAAMRTELRNPDGKVVKALPEPRQTDDEALIKEAKSQFSTHKKELKQVIELQTARLFEAMCAGRAWPQAEWREYLQRHPVAGRLIQRLVWLEIDAQGAVRSSLRPTEDGSLINIHDDEVELAPDSLLRLGHASLVDEETAAAWGRHYKDYKLAPPFPQMARQSPTLAQRDEAGHDVAEVRDRLGWISDTFTLRGAFTKLGYQRAQAEDGGFFYQYTKDFSTVGVRVVVEFSGNALPEENVPAALKTLSFENSKARNWNDRALPLGKVPPVLLAEAYADYHAIAQACAGFDAGWEKKMPW